MADDKKAEDKKAPQAQQAAKAKAEKYKVAAKEGAVNLRREAGLHGEVLNVLTNGSVVSAAGTAETDAAGEAWQPVQYGKVKGYMMARYLEMIK